MSLHRHPAAVTRRLLVAVLLLLCAAPAAARADDPFDFAGPVMATSLQIADAHWGSRPCGGQIGFVWVDQDPSYNAVSSWVPTAPTYSACVVSVNRDADWDQAKFCTIIVHELGHLSGYAHSPDPDDVMYAYYDGPLAACAAAFGGSAPATPASNPLVGSVPDPEATLSRRVPACGSRPRRLTPRYRRCVRAANRRVHTA